MNTLIERLEALTAPCREVDALIELAVGENGPAIQKLMNGSPHNTIDEIAKAADRDAGRVFYRIATYTASIDSAITLVPKGWFTSDFHAGPSGGNWWNLSRIRGDEWRYKCVMGAGKYPAIALCIAALKARDAS